MSYEYNIHYFYKDILKTIIEELEKYSVDQKDKLKYPYLLGELKKHSLNIDIKTNINIGIITKEIMNQILELVDRYYYKIYFEYAESKLKDLFNEEHNIKKDYRNLWTGYNLDDLAKEFDDKFNQITGKLDISINIINTDFINKDLVHFCSLKFIYFNNDKLADELERFLTRGDEESKNKLIEAFYRKNRNKDNKYLHNIISKYLDFLKELHERHKISHRDVDNITQQLFVQQRILEILTFRLITKAGFPSLLNIKYNEYEIDLVALVDEPSSDGSGIRLIEVTTRKYYSKKLEGSRTLLDKLREKGIDKIKMIFITFEDITDKEDDNKDIYIISFYKLIEDYPYKLISTLYY
jgi:hypothetical protein